MSQRSFLRHYRNHTGRTPSKVVEALRLEAARHLLLNTDHPMKDIAARCGFGNEATFLRRFAKSFGTSPGQHRAHFGSQMRG
ncbi:helix-turn-helix domain-containing protein [Mesorhizobium sp.]|uniref:helix-turn-helix domain-containing protein n=1 Tax=Mesorhizobium sp. TaxID=1871066 RepID=UPI0025EF7678|nr:helix-turn-helix domain-containing protein [Mesorhizobium sp.]